MPVEVIPAKHTSLGDFRFIGIFIFSEPLCEPLLKGRHLKILEVDLNLTLSNIS
jgi:hypothetical protein